MPAFSVSRAAVVDGTHVRVYFTCPVENNAANRATSNFTFGGSFELLPRGAVAHGDYIDVEVNQMKAGVAHTVYVTGVRDVLNRRLSSPTSATFTGAGGSPQLAQVTAIDSRTVQVVFDEPMTNSPTLRNPANYTFSGTYSLTALSVTHINSRTVNIATTAMTSREEYEIAIVNVFDLLNNVIDSKLGKKKFTSSDRPKLLEAEALSNPARVRLSFDRAMKSTRALLDWDNFTFSGPQAMTVNGAYFNGAYAIEVDYPDAMDGETYTVTVGTGQDLLGREIDPYYRTASFAAVSSGGVPLRLTSASHVGGYDVLLTFNQALLDNAQLRNVANYTVTGGTVTVLYVTQRNPNKLLVTLNTLVRNTTYRITVANLTSVFETTLDEIDTAIFTVDFMRVSAAWAMADRKVDVWFDRPVKVNSALLNPANYVFSGASTAAAELVVQKNSNAVRVTIAQNDLLVDGTYTVFVYNVRGIAGEYLDSVNNHAHFVGRGTAPVLDSAYGASETTIVLTFDEPMNAASLASLGNYSVASRSNPWLMYAEAIASNTVRVIFNDDVSDSALTATNYTFDAPTGLTLSSGSVARVSGDTVDITVLEEMRTGEENYTIYASGIYDTFGNLLSAEHDSYDFDGNGVDPQVVSATYVDPTHVDVLFDQTVEETTAEDVDNYLIDGQSTPDISTAALDGDTVTVHLTLGTTLTTGDYTVTVSNVTDLIGSAVDPANDSATFSPVGLPSLPFANHETLTNGLIAYYQMDGSPNDYFDNALHGTFPAGTPDTVTGVLGTGYQLSPRDDYALEDSVILPDDAVLDNLSYCTISAWVYIAAFDSVYYHTVGGRYGQFALGTTVEGRLYVQTYTSDGIVEAASTAVVPTGGWHHLVGLWNGLYIQGYIDGVRVLSTAMYAVDHPIVYTPAGGRLWRLGCAHNPPSISNDIHSPLIGYCDELGIWGRALTRSEVEDLYNSGVGLSIDVIAPQLDSASFVDNTHVEAVFNEYVEETSAETTGNYSVSGPTSPNVIGAALDSDLVTVQLELDADMVSGDYTVSVINVEDIAGNPIDTGHDEAIFTATVGPFGGHASLSGDLVAYYPLEGSAVDSHTSGLDGSLIGVPPVAAGKINNCLTFNAAGEAWPSKYVDIPSAAEFDAMTSLSVSAWINIYELGVAWWHVVAARDGSFQVAVAGTSDDHDRKIYFSVTTVGGLFQNVSDRLITASIWHHLVCTYDGSRMKYYLDGDLKQDDVAAGGNLTHGVGEIIRLSAHPDGYNALYGLIDEVGIWDKALSLTEVQDLYNSGSGLGY